MSCIEYSYRTDKKWQSIWKETGIYRFDSSDMEKKLYLLEMFSYPSGKNLHIGHWWNYGLSDCYGRLKHMQGYNVFHPVGFDAFGLPAENYAIKTGIHPMDSTRVNIETMERQFHEMGIAYDWEHELITCEPEYYKWTQWLFIKLYERGLAYRKNAPVNWCPSCGTVLANEQVSGGRCERCDTEVRQKNMTQWFFRITDYAEEMLSGLDDLDWPDKTKKIQTNWIGKSEGCEILFRSGCIDIWAFTTRADTLMGVTSVVLAPEHPSSMELTLSEYRERVGQYINSAARKTEIERLSADREKTGVFTGSYAVHPITKEKLPVWISDFVVFSYGTGAVMSVPAHDERDHAFAKKYDLPVRPVLSSGSSIPYSGDGTLINSGEYDNLSSEEARMKIASELESSGYGRKCVKYRLRDWLVSRQRYWGCPIPVIYCPDCGIVTVREERLPVILPYDVSFTRDGRSPLASCPEFTDTVCPRCGSMAKRESDTLDTFVCSSWYYLRFIDNKNSEAAFDSEKINTVMPVDKYVGGVEHASMHLLYARFITKALRDMGYLSFGEPFTSLFHQGNILDSDGKRMSKRSGAIAPDSYIGQYGSDALRLHLCFGFSYKDGGPWNDAGIRAMSRFIKRVAKIAERFLVGKTDEARRFDGIDPQMEYTRNSTIKQVTEDIDSFQFNTAVARIMEYANAISAYQNGTERNMAYEEALIKDLVLLLAPLAPHFSEELWQALGYEYSVHDRSYPGWDEAKLQKNTVRIAVQVNGKLKHVMTLPVSDDEEIIKTQVLSCEKVRSAIAGREISKLIVVKNRLVNIVV